MKFLLQTIVFLVFYSGYSQLSAIDVVKKMQEHFKQEIFNIEMDYNTYATYVASDVYLSYKSSISKKNENSCFRLHHTDFINISLELIKISHDQKLIQYHKITEEEQQQMNPMDIEKLMPYFVKNEINKNGNEYHCVFYTSGITQLPYSKIELVINASSYQLKKQVMYLNKAMKYTDKSGSISTNYPRIEIVIKKWNSVVDNNVFKLSTYLSSSSGKVTLAKQYKEYQLVD